MELALQGERQEREERLWNGLEKKPGRLKTENRRDGFQPCNAAA
jgi:hypothetical protein